MACAQETQNDKKKKTTLYKERDESKRLAFLETIAKISSDRRVYVDESGIDSYLCRSFGWAKRGLKVFGEISGKRFDRESFIAAKCESSILAPFCFKRTCNTELFNFWLETFLAPVLKPGQVVIMDNATFHKSQKTKQIIEKAGCSLLFLPPYSPDLNPIETFWANFKARVRASLKNFPSLAEAINYAFSL